MKLEDGRVKGDDQGEIPCASFKEGKGKIREGGRLEIDGRGGRRRVVPRWMVRRGAMEKRVSVDGS
jgi:hypothetical protein